MAFISRGHKGADCGGREVVPGLPEVPAGPAHRRLLSLSLRPQTMLRNRRTSYQELCDHEDFLTQLSGELIKTIQDTEDGAALKVRMLLQQQDVYTVILPALAPQPRLGPAAPPPP